MPTPTLEKVKETRAKRVPETVRFLTDDQVRKVIAYTFSGRPTDDLEFVERLRFSINGQLKWLVPEIDSNLTSDIEDIRKALAELGTRLVASAISQLTTAHQEMQTWFNDKKATRIVAARQTPRADLQTVAGHLLPDIFQMTLIKKFGSGRNGPGPRFVASVLWEAGLRPDDGETTSHFIRKARKRMLKSRLSGRHDGERTARVVGDNRLLESRGCRFDRRQSPH